MTYQEQRKIERQMHTCGVVMAVCIWVIGITSAVNIVLAVAAFVVSR